MSGLVGRTPLLIVPSERLECVAREAMRRRSLGIHIVDVLGRPVSEIPARQNLAILDEIRMTVAGTAAGVSVDMAKLGLGVIAMGAIGNDEIGEFLLGVMQRYGIDTEHIKRKAEAQTSSTMLPIRPNGERPALHVIGANGELTYSDIDLDVIAQVQFLHLGGTPLLLWPALVEA
jgi:sugar/nucleoside kinase (ribokinase family)